MSTGTEARTGIPIAPAISSRSLSRLSLRPIASDTIMPITAPASAPTSPVMIKAFSGLVPMAIVADSRICAETCSIGLLEELA